MSDAEQTEKQAEQQPEQQQQQQLDAPQQQHEQPTPQQQEQQQQPEPAQQQNQPSTEQPQPQQPQQQEQQQVAAKPPKSGKQRNLRKKRALEDDPEDAATAADEAAAAEVKADLLHGLKLLQKQRKRTAGIDASKLVPAAADDGDGFGDNELMDAQYVKAEGTAKSQILDEETHMQVGCFCGKRRRRPGSACVSVLRLQSLQQQHQLPQYAQTAATTTAARLPMHRL